MQKQTMKISSLSRCIFDAINPQSQRSFILHHRLYPTPLPSSLWHLYHLQPRKAFLSTTPITLKRKKTLYEVLNVSHTADKQQIKSSFYKLSKEHHPDRNPDSEESHAKFLEINEAYSTLSNETKRKEYDRSIGQSESPFSYSNSGTSRSGPHMSSIRRHRETIRPDDWIQYRRNANHYPGAGSSSHHGRHPYGHRVYNFEEHQAHHYGMGGDSQSRKEMREAMERRKKMYQNIMQARELQTRLYMYGTLAIFFIAISGYIRLLFL